MGFIANPASSGAGGPFGTAYTQTYATSARSHVKEALATNISLALLTEVAPILNKQNETINELKTLLNSVIDDLQTGKILS
jgi:hypothetical protein